MERDREAVIILFQAGYKQKGILKPLKMGGECLLIGKLKDIRRRLGVVVRRLL